MNQLVLHESCAESIMSNTKVIIPFLPVGNAASVANMVRKAGGEAVITSNPLDLINAQRIIITGVGAFDAGMRALIEGGWMQLLDDVARSGDVPILGICLGMQVMCRRSEEGDLEGFGWFDAEVKRICPQPGSGLKVPHMGWNTIRILNPCGVLSPDEVEQRFYFVHSYHAVCDNSEKVVATTYYGDHLTAAIADKNIYGVQFHPEKSHRFGEQLIKKFLGL